MEMPSETGLRLINAKIPNFAYIVFNRNTSAAYDFIIRGFTIWDDPKNSPVFADAPAAIIICGTETVKVNKTPIRKVFERVLTRTRSTPGVSYVLETAFGSNFTMPRDTLCGIKGYTATPIPGSKTSMSGVYAGRYPTVSTVNGRKTTVWKTRLIINQLIPVPYKKFNLNAITKGNVVAPIQFEMATCSAMDLQLVNRT